LSLRDLIAKPLALSSFARWTTDIFVAAIVLLGLGIFLGPDWPLFLAPVAVMILLFRFRPREANTRLTQAGVLSELAAALEQGVPLDEFAAALAADSGSKVAASLRRLSERLRQGVAFSTALRDSDLVPEHTVLAVQAGEVGGGRPIPNVLRRAADDLRAQSELRTAISFWVYYFIVVFVICGGLWLVCVLLRFEFVIRLMGGRLSLRTRLLLSLPHLITHYGLPLLGLLVAVRALAIPRHSPVRRALLWLQSFLPLLGPRLRHRALARAARILAALSESGLTLPEMCRAVALPPLAGPYANHFEQMAGRTEAGRPLSQILPDSGLPVSFTWFMRAGASGNFARAMQAAAEYHDARADRLDRLLAMLLPAFALSASGLLVAWFYFSLLRIL
jgi:type II secretory pathway component PulF